MNKIYFDFKLRIILLILILIITIPFSICLLLDSFNMFDKNEIKYLEENYMDYTVSLKDNNLFEEKIMSKDSNYIASLIDDIKINYAYNFKPEELIKGTYKYNVNATINIINHLTGELYYKKEFILIDSLPEYILKSDLKIRNSINIDYDYFNEIANTLLPYYGEHAKANLFVDFSVEKDLDTTTYYSNDLNNVIRSYVIIPLTSEAINVKIQSGNISKEKSLYLIQQYDKEDDKKLIYSLAVDAFILIIIIDLVKLIKAIIPKTNKYDKKLKYIKHKYNKIIVDISTQPDLTNYKIIKINDFDELLDVRNSYKEPIRFYEITPHIKSQFLIIHNNEVFLYTLKEVDLER